MRIGRIETGFVRQQPTGDLLQALDDQGLAENGRQASGTIPQGRDEFRYPGARRRVKAELSQPAGTGQQGEIRIQSAGDGGKGIALAPPRQFQGKAGEQKTAAQQFGIGGGRGGQIDSRPEIEPATELFQGEGGGVAGKALPGGKQGGQGRNRQLLLPAAEELHRRQHPDAGELDAGFTVHAADGDHLQAVEKGAGPQLEGKGSVGGAHRLAPADAARPADPGGLPALRVLKEDPGTGYRSVFDYTG